MSREEQISRGVSLTGTVPVSESDTIDQIRELWGSLGASTQRDLLAEFLRKLPVK